MKSLSGGRDYDPRKTMINAQSEHPEFSWSQMCLWKSPAPKPWVRVVPFLKE